MIKRLRFSAVLLPALNLSFNTFAQSATITGKITNSVTKESVGAVSVTIKGTSEGTFTNQD